MFGLLVIQSQRAWRRMLMILLRPRFGSYGRNLKFDPHGTYSYNNIHVGHDSNLGLRPTMLAGLSRIFVGSHVIFGPEVTVIAGGHNMTSVGRFLADVHEKTGREDLGVTIDDDVWIGARSVVLRGVDVARGVVIGAGSVVTKSAPPYAVIAGNPARVLRFRFTPEEIVQHEQPLYEKSQRFSLEQSREIQLSPTMRDPRRTESV